MVINYQNDCFLIKSSFVILSWGEGCAQGEFRKMRSDPLPVER